jgi:DNA-binding transcriptional LysR family regulator
MNLTDLASFVRVADLGTITAAAEAEGVPKSTISRRIARLEDDLGVELLRRSARSFTLTDDGRLVHARSAGALRELTSVEQALTDAGSEPHGRLVITAPNDFGRTQAVAELLCEYRRRWPQVTVDARLENRVMDLVSEGVDVAIRLHGGTLPGEGGLMSRSVGRFSAGAYASPEYLERRGTPKTPAELFEHDVAAHKSTLNRPLLFVRDGNEERLRIGSAEFETNDFGMVQSLVEAGAAVALLPQLFAAPLERRGRLVRLLPEWTMKSGYMALIWPSSRHLAPRVRAFIDLATEWLTEENLVERDWPNTGTGPQSS